MFLLKPKNLNLINPLISFQTVGSILTRVSGSSIQLTDISLTGIE